MDIGQKIRELRERRGLNQEEFAQSIGVSQRMISYYETGKGGIPDKVIKAIIDRYALPKDYFEGLSTLTPSEKLVERLIELTKDRKAKWEEYTEYSFNVHGYWVEFLEKDFRRRLPSLTLPLHLYFCFLKQRGYAIIQADMESNGKRSPDRLFLGTFFVPSQEQDGTEDFCIIDSFSEDYTGLSDLYAMIRDTFSDTSEYLNSLIEELEDL